MAIDTMYKIFSMAIAKFNYKKKNCIMGLGGRGVVILCCGNI
jgi:hypothetical protein